MGERGIAMNQRTYLFATGFVFTGIAFLHFLRLLLGWEAMIGGWAVPHWVSWVALPIASYLAYEGFRVRKSSR
jgi:hypothetical protein